jgi:hypothetical protein
LRCQWSYRTKTSTNFAKIFFSSLTLTRYCSLSVGRSGLDLVEQLDQIKTIAVAGGLDDALAACANAVRSNFKAAKDKKVGRG